MLSQGSLCLWGTADINSVSWCVALTPGERGKKRGNVSAEKSSILSCIQLRGDSRETEPWEIVSAGVWRWG